MPPCPCGPGGARFPSLSCRARARRRSAARGATRSHGWRSGAGGGKRAPPGPHGHAARERGEERSFWPAVGATTTQWLLAVCGSPPPGSGRSTPPERGWFSTQVTAPRPSGAMPVSVVGHGGENRDDDEQGRRLDQREAALAASRCPQEVLRTQTQRFLLRRAVTHGIRRSRAGNARSQPDAWAKAPWPRGGPSAALRPRLSVRSRHGLSGRT